MPRHPLIVLADDLTGAAEIAAIAHEHGLTSVVLTQTPAAAVDADVLVLDTDTRLARPAAAARQVRVAALSLNKLPHGGIFKKVDSVLRGPVLAELKACAAALGLARTLLVAGNPSLGRTILDGQLFIAGLPVNQTAFAHDPHHPLRSASVLKLLGKGPGVVARSAADTLPEAGIIVCDHFSPTDTRNWAKKIDATTLPAGGADFFRAWLRTKIARRRRHPHPPAKLSTPALLLHGTSSAPCPSQTLRFKGLRAPSAIRVSASLRDRGGAVVAASPLTLDNPKAPASIAAGFTGLARTLRASDAFRHLLVTGGATSASVLRELGWTRLEVTRVWGPGVVSLKPAAAADCLVTLKPGSYIWPASIRRALPLLFPDS